MEHNIENNNQAKEIIERSNAMGDDINGTNNTIHANSTTTSKEAAKILGIIVLTVLGVLVSVFALVSFINSIFNWTLRVETPASPIYMQDWDGCDSLSVDDMIKLTDKRDGELYVVGKQADGKCWMLENLSLDLTNQQVQSNMNSYTTNASDTTLTYLINGGGSDDDQFAKESIADWSLSNSYNDYSRPLIYTGLQSNATKTSIFHTSVERIGNYYNYCATSAGSYCYENDMIEEELNNTESEITEDICPAGWRLPTKNEFNAFLNLESPIHNLSYKDDGVVAGKLHTTETIGSCKYIYDYDQEDYYEKNIKKLFFDTSTTRYWSSTKKNIKNNIYAYTLDIGLYNDPSVGGSPTSNGFTIRCLHK